MGIVREVGHSPLVLLTALAAGVWGDDTKIYPPGHAGRFYGRNPAGVRILPGIVPVIGATEAEAHALEAELNSLIRPEYALPQLAELLQVDVADLRLDRELPENLPEEQAIEGAKSRRTLVVELGRRERLTVRQLIARLGGGRGHLTFAGTPEQIADAIGLWFDGGAADGFNIMPPMLPRGLSEFVDHVVPILRSRGLFRTEYEGRTLREHYGLARPANRNTAGVPGVAASA